jgi:hypothetical protein
MLILVLTLLANIDCKLILLKDIYGPLSICHTAHTTDERLDELLGKKRGFKASF